MPEVLVHGGGRGIWDTLRGRLAKVRAEFQGEQGCCHSPGWQWSQAGPAVGWLGRAGSQAAGGAILNCSHTANSCTRKTA